jgi:hypothetical protein
MESKFRALSEYLKIETVKIPNPNPYLKELNPYQFITAPIFIYKTSKRK